MSNQREVIFTKDFANRSKGDKAYFDSMLAGQLVHSDKVANYTDVKLNEAVENLNKKPSKSNKKPSKK